MPFDTDAIRQRIEASAKTIASLRNLGISILLVEQNARAALETADVGYVLETGQVTQQGAASELIGDPKLIAAYLGGH